MPTAVHTTKNVTGVYYTCKHSKSTNVKSPEFLYPLSIFLTPKYGIKRGTEQRKMINIHDNDLSLLKTLVSIKLRLQ